MRYLIITYYQKAGGKTDEVVDIVKHLKSNILQTANVILDFKNKQVVKCSLNGTSIPKDWQHIRDFYHQHYRELIESFEKVYSELNNEQQTSVKSTT